MFALQYQNIFQVLSFKTGGEVLLWRLITLSLEVSKPKILVLDFGVSIINTDILHHTLDWSLVSHGLMDLIHCRTCSCFLAVKIEPKPTCWQVNRVLFSATLCAVSCASDNSYGLCLPIAAGLRYSTVWAQLKLENTILRLEVSFVLYFG